MSPLLASSGKDAMTFGINAIEEFKKMRRIR